MIEVHSINKKIEVVVKEENKEVAQVVEKREMIEIDTIPRVIAIIIVIARDLEIVMTMTVAVKIQEIRVEIEIIITIIAIVIIREIINKILEIMIDVLEIMTDVLEIMTGVLEIMTDVQQIIAQAIISHIREIMKLIINDPVVMDIRCVIIHTIEIINQ